MTMFSRFIRPLVWLSWAGLLMTGCQSTDEAPTKPEPPTEVASAKPLVEHAPAKDGPTETLASDKSGAAAGPAPLDRFTPPFPDRTDPFEPPKRAASTVRRGDQPGESVELKGFVNVDGPRVVLAIDGIISPLAEGGEKYGVRVIAIQPPSVVLQRGRSRWTATLE